MNTIEEAKEAISYAMSNVGRAVIENTEHGELFEDALEDAICMFNDLAKKKIEDMINSGALVSTMEKDTGYKALEFGNIWRY